MDSYVLRQPRWTSPCRMGWSWGFGQTQTRQRVMVRGRVGPEKTQSESPEEGTDLEGRLEPDLV